MPIYFITGNKNKFAEVKAILGNVKRLDIDLPEIQDIDAENVVRAKLVEALGRHCGEFIVEDTSLYLDCLNGLPGPLIKWFLKAIGTAGLSRIAEKLGNLGVQAKTIVGYAKSEDKINFFEGTISGKIVAPRGEHGFGWDEIFQPTGSNKTFAQMSAQEKNAVSMRQIALEKLKAFLASQVSR